MNKIEAIIRPEKLTSVTDALERMGLVGLNVVHITSRGAERKWRTGNRGVTSYPTRLLPKVKLELVVSDADTHMAVDIIMFRAWTGEPGDGKVFVIPVAEAYRIRTGEHGEPALNPGTNSSPNGWPDPHPELVDAF